MQIDRVPAEWSNKGRMLRFIVLGFVSSFVLHSQSKVDV
jgi:hypothetical protein